MYVTDRNPNHNGYSISTAAPKVTSTVAQIERAKYPASVAKNLHLNGATRTIRNEAQGWLIERGLFDSAY